MATVSTLTANLELNSAQFRKEMDRAKARTKSYQKTAKKTAKTNNVLKGSFRGAAQGIAAIDGPLGGVSSRISAVSGLLTASSAAWVGLGAAIAGVAFMSFKSIGAFEKMEQQQLKTQAILKATGGAAGITSVELDSMARAVALSTLASSEGVREAQNALLTFKAVGGDVFRETIKLSQDLASAGFGSLKTNAIGLGKALQDPLTGLMLLSKQGSLTKAQQNEIGDAFKRTGDLGAAQASILAAIREQVGGAGSGAAGGLSGSTDTLSQRWEELLEGWAKSTGSAGIAQAAIDTVADSMNGLRVMVAPTAEEMGRMRLSDLHTEYVRLGESIERVNRAKMSDGRKARLNENLIAERKKIAAEMSAIQDEEKQRIIASGKEAAAAKAKGEALRQQASEEAQAATAIRQQEKDQKVNDRIISMQEEKFRRIHEAALGADEQMVELENFRYEREQEQFDLDMERMQERGLLTAEVKQQFRDAEADAESIHQTKLTKIQKDEGTKKLASERALAKISISIAQDAGALLMAVTKKGSAAYKIGFAIQKAAAVAQAIVSAEVASVQALATLGPVAGPPMAAMVKAMGYASAGIIAGTAIAGIAHGGLDNVPSESTYLLDKGERVLSPNQNQDLTSFLKSGGSGSAPVINIINNSGSEVEQSQNGSQIDIIIGKVKDAISDDVGRGTGVSIAMQNAFGLQRMGMI